MCQRDAYLGETLPGSLPELVKVHGARAIGIEHSAPVSFSLAGPAKRSYLIIMRTVCGSKGLQSPFTSAVFSSASVRAPLPSLSTAPKSLHSASLSFPSRGGAGVGGGLCTIGGRL